MTLIDYDDSVHNDHFDTLRVLVWIVESGAVGNRLGVEEDEIGGIAHGNCATVRKAKGSGRAAGHLVDSLWEADKADIPDVMSENPGKRSIETGVWLALSCYAVRRDARTIRANSHQMVGQDYPHVVLRHRAHEYSGGTPVCDD
jgi:hypothetical protein